MNRIGMNQIGRYLLSLVVMSLLLTASTRPGYGDAIGPMSQLLMGDEASYDLYSGDDTPHAASHGETPPQGGETQPQGEETKPPAPGATSGGEVCPVPPQIPKEVCELGMGLCLNTPPGSVREKYVIIKGTVDKGTSFGDLKFYVQHEYTRQISPVRFGKVFGSRCWEEGWVGEYDGCMDGDGRFAARIPLSELGPYTITVRSSSLTSASSTKSVRTSLVVAPRLDMGDIYLDPAPGGDGVVSAPSVNITIDLLKGCSTCDFIGASTGGLEVRVLNRVETVGGGVSEIRRSTDLLVGGKYTICVPLLEGTNRLSVSVCNAAVGDKCPTVDGIVFKSSGLRPSVEFSPISDGGDLIGMERQKLTVQVSKIGECNKGDATFRWNSEMPVDFCPDANGRYTFEVEPKVGINVGTVEVKSGGNLYTDAVVFAAGKRINPYSADEGWVDEGIDLSFGADIFNETIREVVNRFLSSGNIKYLIDEFLSSGTSGSGEVSGRASDQKGEEIGKIMGEIPYCKGNNAMSNAKIELSEGVSLDSGELMRLDFGEDAVRFKLFFKGLKTRIRYFKDASDRENYLPLLLSFKGLGIDGKLELMPGGRPLILISSDNTNCSYQSASYCTNKPALIIPKNIAGDATKGGSFVRCDDNGELLTDEAKKRCKGLNIVNAESGLLSQEVLNLINDMLYCRLSAELTYALINLKDKVISFPIFGKRIYLGFGIDFSKSHLSTDKAGIKGLFTARFGGEGVVPHLSKEAPITGVITGFGTPVSTFSKGGMSEVALSIVSQVLNELLAQAVFQADGGMLDWDIDDEFAKEMGFDFIERCDGFKPAGEVKSPPSICQLRPRVAEMLGTPLSTYDYLGPKHPLRLSVRGSRRFAPYIRIYRGDVPYPLPPAEGEEGVRYRYEERDVLEVTLPDIELTFYALEVDKKKGVDAYGNPYPLLDENGRPVIRSMVQGVKDAPILKTRLTLVVPLEVIGVDPSPEKGGSFRVRFRVIPEFAHIAFQKVKGSNATIISDEGLLSQFREKLNYVMKIYGDPEKPIEFDIGSSIGLGWLGGDRWNRILSYLGIDEVFIGNGLPKLLLGEQDERISVIFAPSIRFK